MVMAWSKAESRLGAAERGIRQFLDIGCAMPASPNVHEIAQEPRTRAQVASFFDGLDLIDPGVVSTVLWRPDLPATEAEAICYAAVAVKP
jgi:hypothetical protein